MDAAVRLKKAGWSQKDIALFLNCTQPSVSRYLKESSKPSHLKQRPFKMGRPRCTTKQFDRNVKEEYTELEAERYKKFRPATAFLALQQVVKHHKFKKPSPSTRTVQRRLAESLGPWKQSKGKHDLSPSEKQERVNTAKERVTVPLRTWQNRTLFIDNKKFAMFLSYV